MNYLTVKADTNDADYVEKTTLIQEGDFKIIEKVVKALKEFKPYKAIGGSSGREWTHHHNFPNSEYSRYDLGEKTLEQLYVETNYLTEDELNKFCEDYCPHGEYGVHTIKFIKIFEGDLTTLFENN